MDNCLRQILQQEVGYGSDLSNNDVLSTKVAVITDAERVQDCTNEHVFAHDSELGISFQIRLSMAQTKGMSVLCFDQNDQRWDLMSQNKGKARDSPGPQTALVN